MKEWTFITNHGLVLSYVADHKRITSREIASALGITERRVQRIISDLEESGYITKSRNGRYNTYIVNTDLSLRHPAQRDKDVKEMVTMLKPLSRTVQKKKQVTEHPRLIPDIDLMNIAEETKNETSSVLVVSSKDEGNLVSELSYLRPTP